MPEVSNIKILLPEVQSPSIAELHTNGSNGLNLIFEDHGLQEALDLLNKGGVDALIVGAEHTSADVIRAGIDTLGTVDGFVSSFFIMEKGVRIHYFLPIAP